MPQLSPVAQHLFPTDRVIAGFTDRAGGVSKEPYHSLNLGGNTGDSISAVRENRRRLSAFAGTDESRIAYMKQVHGAHVTVAEHDGCYPDTDGLVTAVPGLLLGVLIADCVPLLLYDPVNHVAGAIHCGWRSITAGIADRAIHLMHTTWGTEPSSLVAALGPSAGACCYEIGDDVATHLYPSSVVTRGGSTYGDLRGELTKRLINAGLKPDNIENTGLCTICSDRFFSHRRDNGITGRMMGFIALRN